MFSNNIGYDNADNVSGLALGKRLGAFLLLGFFNLIAPIILYVDMVVIKQEISETSVTELLQESFLLLSLVFWLVIYFKNKDIRPFSALVAAFYGVLFIREIDMFLDAIVHGFWKYPAVIVAILGISIAIKSWNITKKALYFFLESPSGIFTAFGVLLVLFFSRLFGSSKIWEPIMGENYTYSYKAAIQEGVELYGYSMIFIGSLMALFNLFKKTKTSDSNQIN